MRRLTMMTAAAALLTVPSLAQAQGPPLPPGPAPTISPPVTPPALSGQSQAPAAEEPKAEPEAAPRDAQTPPALLPVSEAPAAPSADQAPRPAGQVVAMRLKGRVLSVRVACAAGARAKLELSSGDAVVGARRYQCRGSRTFTLRAPRSVVRRARGENGVLVRARISAPGFETSRRQARIRTGSAARPVSVARASSNWVYCASCVQYVFGGFGNQQTLEYWVRSSGGWLVSNGWYLWWGDAQYYQNYASGYVTTYRYWYYWNGSKWVNYRTVNIGR